MIVRDQATDEYLGIKCDECETLAPPAEQIDMAHGLIGMGWHCSGGAHRCPEHAGLPGPARASKSKRLICPEA